MLIRTVNGDFEAVIRELRKQRLVQLAGEVCDNVGRLSEEGEYGRGDHAARCQRYLGDVVESIAKRLVKCSIEL